LSSLDLRELLRQKSNKEAYGVFIESSNNYYIKENYDDSSGFPGFFPCVDDVPGWLGADLDFEDQSVEITTDHINHFFERFPWLSKKLWIERSRHGYHFYVFLEGHVPINIANYVAQILAGFFEAEISGLDACITYPYGDDGNSYFLKNTNDILLAAETFLYAEDIPVDIFERGQIIERFRSSNNTTRAFVTPTVFPLCLQELSRFLERFPGVFRHHNGHQIRIFYANYLFAIGLSKDEIIAKFSIFSDFSFDKSSYYVDKVLEKKFFPPGCKKMQDYMGIACEYCKELQFSLRTEEYDKMFKSGKTFFKKYTRAGYTTYMILKCLKEKKKLLIVEPTHKINEVFDKVRELYGQDFRYVHLRANKEVCLVAKELSLRSGLVSVPRGNCYRCGRSDNCQYPIIQEKLENSNYDIVYCTYHKFALSDISKYEFDAIFFDEFGTCRNLIRNVSVKKFYNDLNGADFGEFRIVRSLIIERFKKLKNLAHDGFHDFKPLAPN